VKLKELKRNGDSVEGIETTKGFIKTKKIGVVAAGHSSVIANMAGIKIAIGKQTFTSFSFRACKTNN
jgi:sarcosine oxidase subunit beta